MKDRTSHRLAVPAIAAAVTIACGASATTWYVPDHFPTINMAIDGVVNGDTIIVRPNTYFEHVDFDGKAVTLRSESGAAVTTIDGTSNGRVVTIDQGQGASAILEGFTITHGVAATGGGLFIDDAFGSPTSPTIRDCIFVSNQSTSTSSQFGGGAIAIEGDCAPLIDGCTFRLNTSARYGGAISTFEGDPDITYCVFEENTASLYGGGIHANGTSFDATMVTVTDCVFGDALDSSSGNDASLGGAIEFSGEGTLAVSDSEFYFNTGGALDLDGGTITITGSTFQDNVHAGNGGAIINVDTSPTITSCVFLRNGTTGLTGGGAIYNTQGADPTITLCTFTENFAGNHGGAIYSGGDSGDNSNPVVAGCTFTGNTANDYGGAVAHQVHADGSYDGCTFEGNVANEGGAVSCQSGSGTVFTDCRFMNNTATETDHSGGGGGVYFWSGDAPDMRNCLFVGNDSDEDGGAIYLYNTNALITNCTIGGNTADSQAGGLYSGGSSMPVIRNTIVRGNTPDVIEGSIDAEYCDVPAGISGTGNVHGDPRYVDLPGGNLRLDRYSPCADSGSNDAVPAIITLDLDGQPRFVNDAGVADTGQGSGAIVDMGAFERQADSTPITIIVTTSDTIQDAIDASLDGDTVLVQDGTYNETIDLTGKAITVESQNGAATTTIDGTDLLASVVTCDSDEGTDTIIQGFTITGGNVELTSLTGGGMYISGSSPTVTGCVFDANYAQSGGGVYVEDGSPVLTTCVFNENMAAQGGGLHAVNASPTLDMCVFTENGFWMNVHGGGLYASDSDPILIECLFSANLAVTGGGMYATGGTIQMTGTEFSANEAGFDSGAAYFENADVTIVHGTFVDNQSDDNSGAIHVDVGTLMLDRSRFAGNIADADMDDTGVGGAIKLFNSDATITNTEFHFNRSVHGGAMATSATSPDDYPLTLVNCTFHANQASGAPAGGALFNMVASPVITNCILWADTPDEIVDTGVSGSIVTYSDVMGGWPGPGNVIADPSFVNASGGDLHLAAGSPVIDAGDALAVPIEAMLDIDDDDRIVTDPDTIPTGLPDDDGDFVDMGADEFQPAIECIGDVNGSGEVGFADLLQMLAAWGPCDGCPEDLDENGFVAFNDLLTLLANWGPCP